MNELEQVYLNEIPQPSTADFRVGHLRNLIDTLKIADELAEQGYLINSAELADLMDVHPNAIASHGNQWVWRNWIVSRSRKEGNQTLWHLERLS